MKIMQLTILMMTGLMMAFPAVAQDTIIQPGPQTTQEAGPKEQLGPKKEGVIRIGVVAVKSFMRQDGGGQEIAELVRTGWYSLLGGPTVELIPIEARLASLANIEAGQKQCDYILYSTISQKAKSSLMGGLLKIAVPVVTSAVPTGVGGTAANSMIGSLKRSVADGAKTAAKNLAGESAEKIRAHDEVTLEFNLVKVDSATSTGIRSVKAKARSDGEDIFSPLIEQAADQIAQAMIKG